MEKVITSTKKDLGMDLFLALYIIIFWVVVKEMDLMMEKVLKYFLLNLYNIGDEKISPISR